MPLANCARCKKMFNKIGPPVCLDCEPLEEADYAKVRDLIEREPNLNAETAAERAGVEVAVVTRMLSQGVITSVNASEKVYCGKCGAPAISLSKRLCQACLDRLNLEVAEVQRTLKQPTVEPAAPTGVPRMNVRRKIEERHRS